MRALVGIIMALSVGSARATANLDCAAPPYYLSFVVSLEYGAQSFTFRKEAELLAAGDIEGLKKFELKWPEPNVSEENQLKIENRFEKLEISGWAQSDKGQLIVNGKRYDLKCDWIM